MWQIILGVYFIVSALVGFFLWLALMIAKKSDERTMIDFPDTSESSDKSDQ